VSRGAALLAKRILEDEEAVAVLRGYLEVNGANAKPSPLAESIFACRDAQRRRQTSRRLQRVVHDRPLSLIGTGWPEAA
jgi:hypothetical protein